MSATPALRVMVVDDHPLIRLGLHQILDPVADIDIVAEADTGVDALRLLGHTVIDMVVLDLAMPGRSGVEILRRIRGLEAAPPVLVYSRFPADQYAQRTLRAGAAGYLMKSAPPVEVVRAIRTVAGGQRYLPERVERQLHAAPATTRAAEHDRLSEREFEILRMLVAGASVSAIANELNLSVKTVSTHRTRILRKLSLTSTADLVHYAIEHGLDDTRT